MGKVGEVRKFLRNIAPVRDNHIGRPPNWELSRYALLLYCGCERLEHTVEDWVHISDSATYLDLPLIERIVQRILAGLVGTPAAKKAFDRLTMRRGVIEVTSREIEDTGLRGNPIWKMIQTLVPVDADARRLLFAYAHYETRPTDNP